MSLSEFFASERLALFLSAVGMGVTLLMALMSILSIARKRRAQALVVELLQHRLAESLRFQRKLRASKRAHDEALLRAYEDVIRQILLSLDDSQRKQVLEGFEQPSARGRANYLRSLIEKADKMTAAAESSP